MLHSRSNRQSKEYSHDISIGSNHNMNLKSLIINSLQNGSIRIVNRKIKSLPDQLFLLSELAYSDKAWWLERDITVFDLSHNEIIDIEPSTTIIRAN